MKNKSHKKTFKPLNLPVVIAVAVLCGLSLALFFIHQDKVEKAELAAVESRLEAERQAAEADENLVSEQEYYNQMADEYIAKLPADKQLLARLVDSVNHHLLYYETGDRPSCYIFDLESLTTSVLFGGENGFYCDTKLVIIGNIRQHMRVDDIVYFVAENRAPETDETNAVVVFSMDIFTHELRFLDSGFAARLDEPDQLIVGHSTFLYYNLFTGENVYDKTAVTYSLPSLKIVSMVY